MAEHVRSTTLPLTVVITSRPENHLSTRFALESRVPGSKTTDICSVSLDTSHPARNDIRQYLTAKFDEIKATHICKNDIARLGDWPSAGDVKKILDKSSGQFIYAVVVMNFVSDACSYPLSRLAIALDRQKADESLTPSPWAALDSMYSCIFAQAVDQSAILYVSFVILAEVVSLQDISSFFCIDPPVIRVALSRLASVTNCQGNDVILLHASLPDFLLNKVRSQDYHINPTEWKTRLCIISLKKFSTDSKDWDPTIFLKLFRGSQGSLELCNCLSDFNPCTDCCSPEFRSIYIKILKNMDLRDGDEIYRNHYELCTVYDEDRSPNLNDKGRRKALLVGISYKGPSAVETLRGCTHDSHLMAQFLIDHGYTPEDIRILTDDDDV